MRRRTAEQVLQSEFVSAVGHGRGQRLGLPGWIVAKRRITNAQFAGALPHPSIRDEHAQGNECTALGENRQGRGEDLRRGRR